MYKKLAKDAAVVFFAYEWSLVLMDRLAALVVNAIFPRTPITDIVANGIGFMLAYLGAWFFFNKWNVRFWIKAVVATGMFVIFFIAGGLIDAAIVSNMPHPQ